MIELIRANDPVLISFVTALLSDAGIGHVVADQNMSVMEGSVGILPRRILIEAEDRHAALRILEAAELGHEASEYATKDD